MKKIFLISTMIIGLGAVSIVSAEQINMSHMEQEGIMHKNPMPKNVSHSNMMREVGDIPLPDSEPPHRKWHCHCVVSTKDKSTVCKCPSRSRINLTCQVQD